MDLFFDTETTGLPPRYVADPSHSAMPHITQFAMKLRETSTRRIVSQAAFYVCPEREPWAFDPGLEERFGVTKDMIILQGIAAVKALGIFRIFHNMADRLIAANGDFDWLMVQALAWRSNIGMETFRPRTRIDVLELATDHCQIPPTPKMRAAGRHHYKKPTLQEAYTTLVNPAGFAGAHDALADVDATIAVFDRLSSSPPREGQQGSPNSLSQGEDQL